MSFGSYYNSQTIINGRKPDSVPIIKSIKTPTKSPIIEPMRPVVKPFIVNWVSACFPSRKFIVPASRYNNNPCSPPASHPKMIHTTKIVNKNNNMKIAKYNPI